MKTYTVLHETARINKMFIIAAENALTAVNIAQMAEMEKDHNGQFHIPANYEFIAEIITGVYANSEGIKNIILL